MRSDGLADPQTRRDGPAPVGFTASRTQNRYLHYELGARNAIRDSSTSFAVLTTLRMTEMGSDLRSTSAYSLQEAGKVGDSERFRRNLSQNLAQEDMIGNQGIRDRGGAWSVAEIAKRAVIVLPAKMSSTVR